jgi:hypothetical protein
LPLQANDPDKGAEMKVIDPATGRVAARFSFPIGRAPGYLLFFDGWLVSQTVRDISVYPAPNVKPRP